MFRADPLGLRHELELSNWQIDPAIPADAFVSTKAQGAGRMAFTAPAPPPKGVKPLTAGKAPAAKAPAAKKAPAKKPAAKKPAAKKAAPAATKPAGTPG